MAHLKRIIITPGEPAGIGPDIILKVAQEKGSAELIVVCDPELLIARANQLNLPITLQTIDFKKPATLNEPGTLKICPIKLNVTTQPGELNAKECILCVALFRGRNRLLFK